MLVFPKNPTGFYETGGDGRGFEYNLMSIISTAKEKLISPDDKFGNNANETALNFFMHLPKIA